MFRHPSSRRRFLQRLALGSAGLAASPLLPTWISASEKVKEGGPGHDTAWSTEALGRAGEDYWEAIRERFLIRPGLIPMNAANLCPAPREVVEATEAAGRDVDGDVSFQNRATYDELREGLREGIAGYLGVGEGEIALVRNTSEANNTIVWGVPLEPGDEVVVFDQNHATNNVAWDVRAARDGIVVRRAAVPETVDGPEELLAPFLAAFSPRTRVVTFSDVSNVTGVRLPVRELCQAARNRGIHAHVDGAQTFGAEPLELAELGCDSYATSSHKWFMGPKEGGVLYVREDRIQEIWPLSVGVGWGSGAETTARGARKFETLGQRNDATFAGMLTALRMHQEVGPERIGNRIQELAAMVKDGMVGMGAHLITPRSPALSGGVVVGRFDGVDTGEIHQRLYSEHGVAGAPTGGLRFCPHIYNTRADVETVLDAVAQLLRA